MSEKWFVTVGYPGGEIASRDEQQLCSLDGPRCDGADIAEGVDGGMDASWFVRPCPPDLVEWLEATFPTGPDGKRAQHMDYPGVWKVSGGWLINRYSEWQHPDGGFGGSALSSTFIPVQGAAGITVLDTQESTPNG